MRLGMELGIYIHIPFCVKKCDYCDFISYSNKFDLQEEYVKKIIEEKNKRIKELEKELSACKNKQVDIFEVQK